MMKMCARWFAALPLAAVGCVLVVLVSVFSATVREMLQQADLDLLASAVALLPLAAVLLASSLGQRARHRR